MQNSKRGFSVVSSLLGFSLLGLSTIGLATYMGSFEEVKVSYARSVNVQFMHSELLSSMEKIITMTNINVSTPTTPSTKKEYGLCTIVKNTNNISYDLLKDKAICPIELEASKITNATHYKDGNTVERFTYFVEEGQNWKLSASSCDKGAQENNQNINGFVDNFADDDFNKCFKYQSKTGVDHIYARLTLEPQKMPAFQKISSGSVLVDELVYKLKSVISVRRELESGEYSFSLSQSAKYLWAAEVLDCHVCNNAGDCKLARFSSSAQGSAARYSKVCYHSMYAAKEKKDALNIIAEKTAASRINKRSNNLVLEDSDDYSAVCRYNLFKCGGVSKRDKRDFDPTLNFRFLFDYDRPEDSSIREVDFKVWDGTLANKFEHGTLLTPANQKAQVTRKKDGSLISFSEREWPLKAGTNEMKAFMADQNSSGTSMCYKICDGTSPSYYPEITVKYGDSNCDGNSQCSKTENFSNNTSRNVACYWCNAKSCHSAAPNTYKKQTPGSDPVDDLIGECDLSNSISGLSGISVSGLSDQSKKCVKYENSTYTLETCDDDTLAGKGWLGEATREVQPIGEKKDGNFFRSDGILPSLALAYNVSITSKRPQDASVEKVLDHPNVRLPKYQGNYAFYNYAQTPMIGHSLFPHYIMQRDASGMFHSGWMNVFYPEDVGSTGLQATRWAYFYREPLRSIDFEDASKVGNSGGPSLHTDISRKEFLGRVRPSRPIYMKMESGFYPKGANTNTNPLILVHHIAFKGITFGSAPPSPPPLTETYLCRNINASNYSEAFVTTTQSRSNGGYQACQALGSDWYFIPPDSKEGMSAALLAVAPNAPRYPFPNPFKFPDGVPFWKECESGLDENGQACSASMNRWELSYKYEDLAANEYKKSSDSDGDMVIVSNSDVLRKPASAKLGGLNAISTSPDFRKSWDFEPNWIKILGSTFVSPYPNNQILSLLFEPASEALLNIYLGYLDNNSAAYQAHGNNSYRNIGAIGPDGRMMTFRDLREASNLSKFKVKSTKICRYSEDETNLDFHKAFIFAGSPRNWPATDDCSNYTASISPSFLSNDNQTADKIFYKIPATPGGSNLRNPTGRDFIEIRKGIRTIVPLLKFNKGGGIYIRNTAKFCKAWKREKKRRAVGNCVVESWNEDNSKKLSVGGIDHSYEIAKRSRKDASICHSGNSTNPATQLCEGVSTYYSGIPGKVQNVITSINNRISVLQSKTFQCPGNRQIRTDKLEELRRRKGDLETLLNCARNAASEATTANCVAAITNETENVQSYTPQALANCSIDYGSEKTYKYDFKSAKQSRCWDIKTLAPESAKSFDGLPTGGIGVVRDSEPGHSWSKNAFDPINETSRDCGIEGGDDTKLSELTAACDGYYQDLDNLPDDDLCNDEEVNYASETCVIQAGHIGSRKRAISNDDTTTLSEPSRPTFRYNTCYGTPTYSNVQCYKTGNVTTCTGEGDEKTCTTSCSSTLDNGTVRVCADNSRRVEYCITPCDQTPNCTSPNPTCPVNLGCWLWNNLNTD